MADQLPQRIGKYAVSGVLGRGAMGVVYRGFDPHIHRPVAIKTIRHELGGADTRPDSLASRFRNEAQAVGRIAHPGVVAIYELGEDAGLMFIAMELVEGRSLDKVLQGTPKLGLPLVLSLVDQLLDALQCAHQNGVWHRDVKPANLLLTADGRLKLTDFGIARLREAGLTQVSSMIGSPGYMAPEQYRGEDVDHRVDLFAAGVLLYRLLTGVAPFVGTAEEVMHQVFQRDPLPPSRLAREPEGAAFDAIVAKALAKQVDARFASAMAFRTALREAAQAVSPIVALDAQETLIAMKAELRSAIGSAGTPIPPTASSAFGAGPTGWDPLMLSQIERSLSSYIGPIAKVLIRNASRQHHNLEGFATALAQHIQDEAPRRAFLHATLSSVLEASSKSSATPASNVSIQHGAALPALGLLSSETMSEAYQQQVEKVVTRRLGPIGKVIVARAARQCDSRSAFVLRVIASSPEADQPALARDLQGLR